MGWNKRDVRFLIVLGILVVWNLGPDIWFVVHPLHDRLWPDYWEDFWDYECCSQSYLHPFLHPASHASRWWFPVMALRGPAFCAFGMWILFFRLK
jgi:hypothetical protein